jgi:hypothetical protein
MLEIESMASGTDHHILKGPFNSENIFVGASIRPPSTLRNKVAESGTLAAYFSAETKNGEILLAQTNDHVCFNNLRPYQGLFLLITIVLLHFSKRYCR